MLLLIVLSLLVLFVLAGLTFLVVAGQYRRTTLPVKTHEQSGDAASRILDMAAMQLLRGPKPNERSVLVGHDLLSDLYGNDSLSLPGPTPPAPAGPMPMPSGLRKAALGNREPDGSPVFRQFVSLDFLVPLPLAYASDHFNGCVLTFVGGPFHRVSTRVISFTVVNGAAAGTPNVLVTIELPESIQPPPGTTAPVLFPAMLETRRFVLNGRAFNGTGAGLDLVGNPSTSTPPTWNLDAVTTLPPSPPVRSGSLSGPTALMPNFAFNPPTQNMFDAGGLDESYDAVDFQNMYLAWLSQDPVIPPGTPLLSGIIPSFHRPELLNYWQAGVSSGTPLETDAALLRKVMLRPNWLDHPGFTGSNPEMIFNPAAGPGFQSSDLLAKMIYGKNQTTGNSCWDVDNDMDGVTDSVWVDLGLPPQHTPDGRLYKPLFAFLCVDLDSRININAHGSWVQQASNTDYNQPERAGVDLTAVAGFPMPSPTSPLQMPVASGFGPADIPLGATIIDSGPNPLLTQDTLLADRYREFSGGVLPGKNTADDAVSWFTQQITPDIKQYGSWKLAGLTPIWGAVNGYYGIGSYGSPPDLHGSRATLINHAGQPYVYDMWPPNPDPNTRWTETNDDPYELNLISPKASDRIFRDEDLERVLRFREYDQPVMSQRLGGNVTLEGVSSLLTSRSFDVPVPNVVVRRQGQAPANNFVEAVRQILRANNYPDPPPNGITLDDQIRIMLPFEIRRGERFNINRLFGQGLDDNVNNVVDEPWWEDLNGNGVFDGGEPGEPPTGTVTTDSGDLNYYVVNPPMTSNGPLVPRHAPAQQTFARHLYCLLMLIKEPGVEIDFDQDPTNNTPIETARGLAQWCVNVVDFRDADAVMTPFEYDINPLDGWQADGDITDGGTVMPPSTQDTDGHPVVWGCERPELLITETIALHDRRSEDTDLEFNSRDAYYADRYGPNATTQQLEGVPATTLDTPRPDQDFDQRYRPIPSLFVEFYNPWQGATAVPGEFSRGAAGVSLDATVGQGGDPVWRMIVDDGEEVDPDVPLRTPQVPPDRCIFFANVETANPAVRVGTRVHYRTSPNPLAPIMPGRFGVVGPTGREVTGENVSMIGVLVGQSADPTSIQSSLPTTRQIALTQSADPSVAGVAIRNNYEYAQNQYRVEPPVDTSPAVAIVIDREAVVDPMDATRDMSRVFGSPLGISDPLSETYDERAGNRGSTIATSSDPLADVYNRVIDIPLDDPDQKVGDRINYNGLIDDRNQDPDWRFPQTVRMLGTRANYRKLHLQRLANPLLPFHAVTNPYRTIDSAWVDLTVYNGLEVQRDALERDGEKYPTTAGGGPRATPAARPGVQNYWWEPGHARDEPFNSKHMHVRFRTRQRGDTEDDYVRGLWRQMFPAQPLTDDNGNPSSTPLELSEREGNYEFRQDRHKFQFILSHSLGFANNGRFPVFRTEFDDTDLRKLIWGPNRIPQGAFLGQPDTSLDVTVNPNVPRPPFPWLVWNNRPFASAMEMLQVPFTSSSQLLARVEFPGQFGFAVNPFAPQLDPPNALSPVMARSVFGHLLNFFHAIPGTSPQLGRIFDLVETPSLFEGADRWYAGGTIDFLPPFHRLSRFRRPGLVNINTVSSPLVWRALVHGDPAAPTWEAFVRNRRGYADPTPLPGPTLDGSPLYMRAHYPSRFANPFRAATASDLMPNVPAEDQDMDSMPDYPGMRQQAVVEAGLMRSNNPLNPQVLALGPPRDPTGALTVFNQSYNHADRNSYYRYYTMQRLGGTASTHSNCFAVWVTVGYFEVQPWKVNGVLTYDEGHPDGLTLGPEIGSDTGTSQRHRAFYIMDRSIPVGYETGNDLNAWDAVTLRRMIE